MGARRRQPGATLPLRTTPLLPHSHPPAPLFQPAPGPPPQHTLSLTSTREDSRRSHATCFTWPMPSSVRVLIVTWQAVGARGQGEGRCRRGSTRHRGARRAPGGPQRALPCSCRPLAALRRPRTPAPTPQPRPPRTSVSSLSLGPSSAPPLLILRASLAISSTRRRSSAAGAEQGAGRGTGAGGERGGERGRVRWPGSSPAPRTALHSTRRRRCGGSSPTTAGPPWRTGQLLELARVRLVGHDQHGLVGKQGLDGMEERGLAGRVVGYASEGSEGGPGSVQSGGQQGQGSREEAAGSREQQGRRQQGSRRSSQ